MNKIDELYKLGYNKTVLQDMQGNEIDHGRKETTDENSSSNRQRNWMDTGAG